MKKVIETTIRRYVADYDFQVNLASEQAIQELTERLAEAVQYVIDDSYILKEDDYLSYIKFWSRS
jgi:uncharacterized membrane protein